MVLVGALINGLEAAVGGVLGLLFKGRVSERLGDFLLKGQGLAVLLVAVQGMMQGGSVAIVTLSLALGSVIGLGIDIDARIRSLGDWAQRRLNQAFAGSKRLGNFSDGFVTASIFTCTGAMAIVGSLSSGILLDHSTLISKGVIDLAVCLPMSATMGIGVPFCGVSLVVYEGILSVLASLVGSFLTDAVVTEVAVTGSTLLLAVGTNLLGVTDIKVANLIPAAFVPILLVPVATALGLM